MRTSQVIKNIDKCKRRKPLDLKFHNDIGTIIERAANSKKVYLHTGFMEEAEGLAPILPPQELITPIF